MNYLARGPPRDSLPMFAKVGDAMKEATKNHSTSRQNAKEKAKMKM